MKCFNSLNDEQQLELTEMTVDVFTGLLDRYDKKFHICPACALHMIQLTLFRAFKELSPIEVDTVITVTLDAVQSTFRDEVDIQHVSEGQYH